MTSVTEILQTVEHSVDFNSVFDYYGESADDQRTAFWKDILTSKTADTGFQSLVDSYFENGWTEGSAIGWDSRAKSITEGHHRLCLAILLCLDDVPTDDYGEDDGLQVNAHYFWDIPPSTVPFAEFD